MRPHALIVDDDEAARSSLAMLVEVEGFSTATAGDLRQARRHLGSRVPDIALIDLQLPDGYGMNFAAELAPRHQTEIVLVTGHACVESAVDALRIGAHDYITKPIDIRRLQAVLSKVTRDRDRQRLPGLIQNPASDFKHFGRLIGRAPVMLDLYEQLLRIASATAPVLMHGESGTGKELTAQTLHELSPRRDQAFVSVDCDALLTEQIEAELFGGAGRFHRGYLERADGGTLFLSDITKLPNALQARLLRLLDTGRFKRTGSDDEVDVDLRLVAATAVDAVSAVTQGLLRADLFHRLCVFPVRLPPLHARRGDVPLLAEHFLARLNAEHGTAKRFAAGALNALAAQRWPGNLRQLHSIVQRGFLRADEHVSTSELLCGLMPVPAPDPSALLLEIPVGTSLACADRQLILATLQACGGAKKLAAERLGISQKSLYNRLAEYRSEGGH